MTDAPARPTLEAALACPRDGRAMAAFTIADIVVDRCMSCHGLWLDATELRRVAHDEELEQLATSAGPASVRSPFACPRCAGECRGVVVEGVALDTCLDCRGIWLDADELREVRTRVAVGRANAPAKGLRALLGRL